MNPRTFYPDDAHVMYMHIHSYTMNVYIHTTTANEAIAWIRIVRPGSVIGPQQAYLRSVEQGSYNGNTLTLYSSHVIADTTISATIATQVDQAMSLRAENRVNAAINNAVDLNNPMIPNNTTDATETPDADDLLYDSVTE